MTMDFEECNTRESELGMELYHSTAPPTGGKLRKSPEDFRVEEISEFPEEAEDGRFTIAKVTSTNWETNRLIGYLASGLGISRNKIGFAGTKDKRAVTTQLMSFEAPVDRVASIDIHQVEISDPYPSRREMTIGDLIGNAFQIRVADCSLDGGELDEACEKTKAGLRELGGTPNYFGIQRFGAVRPITHIMGKQIIDGDFEGAVMTYTGHPTEYEDPEIQEVRRELEESADFEEALENYPRKLTFERTMIDHLTKNPEDYVGALKRLPSNLQMMFVHAYQSYLFNRLLSLRIKEGMSINSPVVGDRIFPADRNGLPDHDKVIPVTEANIDLARAQVEKGRAFISGVIFGAESEFAEGRPGELEKKIVEEEGLRREDFIVPEIRRCTSTGTRREFLGRVWDLELSTEERAYQVSFSLGKGCYATSLLREFMKTDPMDY